MFNFFRKRKTVPISSSPPAINPSSPPSIKQFKYHAEGEDTLLDPTALKFNYFRKYGGPSATNDLRTTAIQQLQRCPTIILKRDTPGQITIRNNLVNRPDLNEIINNIFTVDSKKGYDYSVVYYVTLKNDTPVRVYQNDTGTIMFIIDDLLTIPTGRDPITFIVTYRTLLQKFPEIKGGKHRRTTRHKTRKSNTYRKSRRRHH